jgi:hypothetical protein
MMGSICFSIGEKTKVLGHLRFVYIADPLYAPFEISGTYGSCFVAPV